MGTGTGMQSVKLTKPWLQYAIGETVEVDPLRAKWLRANGYEVLNMTSDSTIALPAGVKLREPLTDLEIRPPVADLPSPFPSIEITPPPSPRELKIQPSFSPLAVTETQIEDAGDGPAMVEKIIRGSLKNKREPEG